MICHYMLCTMLIACLLVSVSFADEAAGIDVRSAGAVGDGRTLDTAAIQKAIDSCAAKGGGTVRIPAGTYLSGPIFLRSSIRLYLDPGAVLLGSRNWDDYPEMTGRWEGRQVPEKASLITGTGLENVTIEGRGVIDGQGEVWWGDYRKQSNVARPRLVHLVDCRNVSIRGVTLRNSPSWTLHPVFCERINIEGIIIENPADSPNTDGINPDSCSSVHISNCYITAGDDCIAIKSGKDEEGRRVGRPSENITITNCVMRRGHGAVVIGSEMSGGVRNVAVSNCVFTGTQRGIRIKTARGRGGVVENVSVDNVVMQDIRDEAVLVTAFYHGGSPASREPVSEGTPVLRNISISNVRVSGAGRAAAFRGLAEMPIEGLSLSHIRCVTKRGIDCVNVRSIDFDNVEVHAAEGPVVRLDQVNDAWIHGCRASAGTDVFLSVEGDSSTGIRLSGNRLEAARPVVITNAPTSAVIVKD